VKTTEKTILAVGIAFLVLFTSPNSFAGPLEIGPNLVTNGSFEATTDTTSPGFDWNISGAFLLEGFDYFVDTNPSDAQSGSHSFAGGAIGALGFISQDIATVIGTDYNIHIWLANLSGFTDGTAIQVLWDGNVVYAATDIPGSSYSEIVIDAVATSTTTTLAIGLQDDNFFLNVDTISVRQATEQVPEPVTLTLLGLGLAGLTFSRRKQ